ncbi:hypothetical protein GOODEAATRI_001270, partial [Goodea atripinnis]
NEEASSAVVTLPNASRTSNPLLFNLQVDFLLGVWPHRVRATPINSQHALSPASSHAAMLAALLLCLELWRLVHQLQWTANMCCSHFC